MKINGSFVEKVLTAFIKQELSKFNYKKGILGLSGGLDSSVCTFLLGRRKSYEEKSIGGKPRS